MTLITGYGFLRHLFRLPMVFFDQRYRGDLVDRMGNNRDVNDFLAGELAVTVLNIIIAVFYFAILLLYDWRLTMIGMFSVTVCLITVFVSHRAIADKTLKIQMAEGKLFGAICAGLSITATMASVLEPATAARVAPVVRNMPQHPLVDAPSPVQPIAKPTENATVSPPAPYLIHPQSAGAQPTIMDPPTVSEPNRAEYGNPRTVALDQTVAETRFPFPLDQTVAETRFPFPLDQTVAEVLPPLPIDVTVDEKAFAAAGNAMADESVALRAAAGSRFERTFEGKPRGAGTPEQTKAAPTLYQQTTLLLTVRESGEERALQVPLDTGRAVWFGRDGDVQLNPHDHSISRRHFSITLTSSELRLKDNSPNGTKVDGLWIYKEERTIAAGCVITIGGEDQKPCEPTEIVIADIRVPGDWKAPNP